MESIHLSLFMMLCLGVQMSSSEILQRQKRRWIIDSFKIEESYKGPFPYTLGSIKLDKNMTIFQISGQGFEQEPKDTLKIDENSGDITVHKPVDYEDYPVLLLTFRAVDSKDHSKVDTQLGIEILIIDSNDNAPKFVRDVYEVSIPESTKQGQAVTIVQAIDVDSGDDGQFDLKIKSVIPRHDDVQFYLQEVAHTNTGTISFKGCLEHKKAQKYTLIVVATDHGKDIQLSGSCTVIVNIEDGNNHLPVVTGQTGPLRVKEGEENVLVLRVQVKDEDVKGTPAWRAKYIVHGDSNENFEITTDPETNDGLLVVKKHLDYEDSTKKDLSISVENELPFYSCEVKTRTNKALWEVVSSGNVNGQPLPVTVIVEDVNDAPFFIKSSKKASLKENAEAGYYLETFEAKDSDVASNTIIVYRKADDPADWVTVDPKTGKVTTKQPADRESAFVINNTYTVQILAIDNGKPPMTATATLIMHIMDENDNSPSLTVSTLDICQSNKPSKANISAFDLDEGAYGGPFSFKLHGDVQGKWRIESPQGYSVNLVKESKVHSGHYELQLEVSDLQQKSSFHNLSVTVCECTNPEKPNCRIRKSTSSTAGGAFAGIIFLALLLIAAVLLLALLVSCKKKQIKIPEDEGSGQHLMDCNIETPGTDCKVALDPTHEGSSYNGQKIKTKFQGQTNTANQTIIKTKTSSMSRVQQAHAQQAYAQQAHAQQAYAQQAQAQAEILQRQANYLHVSMGASSSMRTRQQNQTSMRRSSGRQRKYSAEQRNGGMKNVFLHQVLKTKLYTLRAPGEELGDYAPHVYAEEKNTEPNDALDAISIPDIPFDPDLDLNLDSRFAVLASVCLPRESTSHKQLLSNGNS
uniref:cadherin-like protein 26 isoform X2 n=1 Tax=Semicossyphus pulcher TaxID=241346 RepID=UPI0037E90618